MRQTIGVVLVVSVLLGGCSAGTYERPVMAVGPRIDAQVKRAPYNGQYRLYAGDVRRKLPPKATALLAKILNKGDDVGFRRGHDGRLVAVAGMATTPVDGNAATWSIEPSPGQSDPALETAVVIGAITLGVIAGAALIAAAAAG